MVTKVCSRAKSGKCVVGDVPQRLTEFHRNKRASDGLTPECKACKRAWYDSNRDRANEISRAWLRANPERVRERERLRNLRKYGLTPEQYNAMLVAQGGRCAICPATEPGGGGNGASCWHVDHNHACCPGRKSCGTCVRGLLCSKCNMVLGLMKDDPDRLRRASDYLEQSAPRLAVVA